MNKSVRTFCLLAMAAAMLLSWGLLSGLRSRSSELAALEADLASSRDHWETVAAEKEALQSQLSDASDALREAQLTLSESETRAGELREDIESLEAELSLLSEKLLSLGIDPALPDEQP